MIDNNKNFKYLKTFEDYISSFVEGKVFFIGSNVRFLNDIEDEDNKRSNGTAKNKQEKGKNVVADFNARMRYYILKMIWSDIIGLNNLTEDQIKNLYFPDNSIVYCYDVIDVYADAEKKESAKYKNIQLLTSTMKKMKNVNFYINKGLPASKVETQKVFGNEPYFIKAVYKPDDIESSIEFPVVAKPSFGHSGLGIKKFNTRKQLSNYLRSNGKESFDLYTQYIDYSREFRSLYVDGKLFYVSERVPAETTGVDIDNKSADTEMDFIYVVQDIPNLPFLNELHSIGKSIYSKMPLRVYSIDFFLTKDNQLKVIEINTQSGLDPYRLISLYETFYSMHVMSPMIHETLEKCHAIKQIFLNSQWKKFKKEIQSSLKPINYASTELNQDIIKSINECPKLIWT